MWILTVEFFYMLTFLVLVRHGQSVWNLENRFTGNTDVDLTSQGREEARLTGEKLKKREMAFEAAFTSVLKRAVETLDIILKIIDQPNIKIYKNAALNERSYGKLQGLNKAEMAEKYGANQVQLWRRSFDEVPPGGESLRQTQERVLPYYYEHIEPLLRQQKNVLVVAHGNSLRALMMHLENISEHAITQVDIPTGVPRLYEFDDHFKMIAANYIAE